MKIYMDWEFLEDGRTIEPISVGLVCEDGREYYAINRDMPATGIVHNEWLMANVIPSLPLTIKGLGEIELLPMHPDRGKVKPRHQIANEVAWFIQNTPDPVLWGWYSAYDHVCLAQLWGRMMDLPEGVPMFTCDLKQEAVRLGVSEEDLPKQESDVHNALADARYNKRIAEYLAQREAERVTAQSEATE